MKPARFVLVALTCFVWLGSVLPIRASSISTDTRESSIRVLVEMYGPEEEGRIRRGVQQVADMWQESDGNDAEFQDFVRAQFLAANDEALLETFGRLEYTFEQVEGHFVSMGRDLRHYMDVDVGPIRPVDRLLAAYSPSAHLSDDMFESKIGFVALLNYPTSTLSERLQEGSSWNREQWAQARLTGRFNDRVPAEAIQAFVAAAAKADAYVSDYNIYMYHAQTEDGRRLFPEGMRLISHWNLRDELKANYAEPDGLEKQRLIATIMDRIVEQTIPEAVIDNDTVDWRPISNRVAIYKADGEGAPADAPPVSASDAPEPDRRYQMLLDIFHAAQGIDEYRPDAPTYIQRSFEEGREIPAEEVRTLFESLFASPVAPEVAALIAQRLGRDLEPFDIWYAGFKPRAAFEESELDAMTKARYPTPADFEADIPRILGELGFQPAQVELLASHIVVDPSRGAGHAMGAGRRDDKAHLRTRVGPDGMDYKGYNIAVHELGHNVEQVFSLNTIDHTLLAGVPGNAFTEALAFVFQERDMELLGLEVGDQSEAEHLYALETFWGTCEIAGAALVDLAVWEWLYENPDATVAEFREATVAISKDVWNRTFGPLMGIEDSTLLGIYSHMLAYPLYLPNYPIGHLIAFQLEEFFRDQDMAIEFERVCQLGNLTPDLWMRLAVGSPLSSEPLVAATRRALDAMAEEAGR